MVKNRLYSDQKILNAVRRKDKTAWDVFFNQFDPLIRSILEWPRWKFSAQERQDVSQNIHLQLQKAVPKFKGKSSLRWFITRIAHQQCVNEVRRQVRENCFVVPSLQRTQTGDWNEKDFICPRTLDPYRELIRSERRSAVLDALKRLQETCRTSITLYYIENFTYQAIAEKLGISVNTVGSRLNKCLNKLHEDLCRHPLFKRSSP
ncbi:RNA polymerase sigma factor [Tichowtungia aerotolerans]|uniref:Sigma-70 family RNA polymerase sigma factor n=1 Tax=Tichowtungia aerotolerans TaxID=2697043 RepID=A0A6P1M5E1_9BACT|nr:sigma-70 family RNA polymerase sigma factor [Tichowtungia aerotolerans]QHI69067.1 sigma-70 family RNA polymerase sigma factor [Tichowtungia aerotolerans]